MDSNQDIPQEAIDVEPQPKRRRIMTKASSNTNTCSSTLTSRTSNNLDLDLPVVNKLRSFLINTDDRKQFLSTYNTLTSLNIFNLNIPVEILHIISQHAIGTVVLCPICKDSETLIMHHDIDTQQFVTCCCDTCDNYHNILLCCLKKPINQKKCDICDNIYCIECYKNQNCLQTCISCHKQFCDEYQSDGDCGVKCPVSHVYYCCECREYLAQCDFCDKIGTSIFSLDCGCCYRNSPSACSNCENRWHGWGSCIECGKYTCSDCIRQCEYCIDATFCQKCMKEDKKKCFECGNPCCDDCFIRCSIECWDKHCKNCVDKCDRSLCENYYCKDCANKCQYCTNNFCDQCIEPNSHNCTQFIDDECGELNCNESEYNDECEDVNEQDCF